MWNTSPDIVQAGSFITAIEYHCKDRTIGWGKLPVPFVDCVLTTHTQVAPSANGNKIVYMGVSSFGLGYVVAALKIKHVHGIRTPRDLALVLKFWTNTN